MKLTMRFGSALVALAALSLAACSSMESAATSKDMGMHTMQLSLTGAQEVPPVQTAATGSGMIMVAADGAVSGKIDTTGINGVAAHIHMGPAGQNGPVIVPLTKSGDSSWVVPAGAKLNEPQMTAYKEGHLYVNVHSPEHKGGEIRAQIMP